jgi:hypothetical protein
MAPYRIAARGRELSVRFSARMRPHDWDRLFDELSTRLGRRAVRRIEFLDVGALADTPRSSFGYLGSLVSNLEDLGIEVHLHVVIPENHDLPVPDPP